jgi:hypothetical protein
MAKGEKKTLLDVEDDVNDVRQLIEAAHMAISDLPSEQAAPVQALLDVISIKLTEARDGLSAYREAAHV